MINQHVHGHEMYQKIDLRLGAWPLLEVGPLLLHAESHLLSHHLV